MLHLNSTIDLDLNAFLHWWKRELTLLIPEKIRLLFNDTQGFLIVKIEPEQLTLSYQLAEQIKPVAVLARNSSALADYQELLSHDDKLRKAKIILRLAEPYAIQRELTLPCAAKENLKQVVSYELDRYTPFKAEQVYFAIKELPRHLASPEQIKVILIVVNRTTFNALCHEVKAIGIIPSLADYEGVTNDLEYDSDTYNLLPDWLSPNNKIPQFFRNSLIFLIFFLLAVAVVLPVWFEYQTVNNLTTNVRRLEKEVREIEALQAELRIAQEETQQLIDAKTTMPATYVMLNRLTQLIPDDTWLNYLQYSDGQLQIQGESPTASALIERLENSDEFNNAAFASPVTQDNETKREHFQINVELTKHHAK